MRRVAGKTSRIARRQVMRVTTMQSLVGEWRPGLVWLVKVGTIQELQALKRIGRAGLKCLIACVDDEAGIGDVPAVVAQTSAFHIGDVVAVTPERNFVEVLYRETDLHHTVFLTNRCNSRCIMCSQPPTKHDDSWLVGEANDIAAHIRHSPAVLGFTGGEPLLLGTALRELLDTFHRYHPNTQFDVLTNGRLFAEPMLANKLLSDLQPSVSWMVPIYGHADFLHDYVVRAEGAFDQTIDGLLTLQRFRQQVQLRTVLIKPVLAVLPELCTFIARNFPFVREVALMGCEPTGFALATADECRLDVAEWGEQISQAVDILTIARIPAIIMNVPLCALPQRLRGLAHRSISDWKQVYAAECMACSAREQCCGLFAWHERGWRPSVLKPIKEGIAA